MFGTRINTLSAGNIVFNYKEGEDTISISNKALTDEEGKTQDTYFDFEVSLESELPETINYNIYLEKDNTSTIEDKAIKVYLTNQEDELIQDITKVSSLIPIKKTPKLLIYKTSINSQGPKTVQKYRLRVWIDKDYDLTNVESTDNGQHIIATEKTYKFKVGVNNEKISNLAGYVSSSNQGWKNKTENEYNFLALYTLDTVDLPETYTFENEEYIKVSEVDVSEQENNGVILGEYKSGNKLIALMGQDGGVIAPQNCYQLFGNATLYNRLYSKYKVFDLSNFNTSNVTNMVHIFSFCGNLISLDLSSLDTINVTNMGAMFLECKSLKSLDLSPLNTSSLTGMGSMFEGCSGLTSLDLSPLNTSKVTGMSSMFKGCSGLTSLDLSPLDTSNVASMSAMFSNCSKLRTLDLSMLNMNKVKTIASTTKDSNIGYDEYGMFYGCARLEVVDISSLNTLNVTSMRGLFYDCHNLISIKGIENFNTTNVTNMRAMFCDCRSLTSINLSKFDTSNVTDMGLMFKGCSGLTSLDLSPLDTSKVTYMSSMFRDCSGLTNLDLSPLKTSNVTDMSSMFSGCSGLTSLDLSMLDLEKLTLISSTSTYIGGLDDNDCMFYGCSNLETLDISSMNTTNITSMRALFMNCPKLTLIKVGCNWDMTNVTNTINMFQNCGVSSVTKICNE